MSKKEGNLRILATGDTLKIKKVNYILYVKLQQSSYWNKQDKHRYINWEMINKSEFCRELNIQRRYLNPRLVELEKAGLIKIWWENKDSGFIKYIYLLSNFDYYVLVDLNLDFFKRMLKFTKDICWRVYLCHLAERNRVKNKYNKDTYFITCEEIAERVGYSKTNRMIIQECNEFLKDIGCITYDKVKIEGTRKVANRYTFIR